MVKQSLNGTKDLEGVIHVVTEHFIATDKDMTAGEIAAALQTSPANVRKFIDQDIKSRIAYVDSERKYGNNYTSRFRPVTAFEPSKSHLADMIKSLREGPLFERDSV